MTAHAPPEVFRTEPLVVGYLGRRDDRLWASTCSSAGVELRAIYESERFGLAASRFGLEAGKAQRAWCWGRHVADLRRPRDRSEAAHEMALAGVWVTGARVELHTDVFGLNDIFIREVHGATYFSNRLRPLVALGAPLGIDWDAWGANLAFYGFVGRSSPFLEIRRLGFGDVLTFDGENVSSLRVLPEWLLEEPRREGGVDEVLAAFRAALPSRFSRRSLAVTLSGGWDSRLIAMVLREKRRRRISAWTIDPDTGFRDDVEHAKTVADALGLRHTVLDPPPGAWLEDRKSLLARVEHQTWLHTWLYPLARRLQSAHSTVVDGLGGDVLFKNLFVSDEMLAITSDADARALLLLALGGTKLQHQWLRPEVVERWQLRIHDELVPSDDPFGGHPSELMLRILTVRTNRVIAASPLRLFGPETRVLMPFMTPAVVRAALAVPLKAKQDHGFYLAVLSAVNRRVARLPSTNTVPIEMRTEGPRRQATKESLLSMRSEVLECDPLRAILAPSLLTLLSEPPDTARLLEHLDLLQWASAFADWHAIHRDVLRPTTQPIGR